MISPAQQKRRALSALYRVLANTGEAQFRALDRLQSLVSEEFAFDVWLSTMPDPGLVDQVITARVFQMSPLRNMKRMPSTVNWADVVKGYGNITSW